MKKKRVETFRNIRYGDGRIIGERERANLVVQLARFFYISTGGRAGAAHTVYF